VSIARLVRRPAFWLPVSGGLLALLLWRARPWDAGSALQVVQPWSALAALAVSAVIPLFWAARSADLLAGAGRPVQTRQMVSMTVFANMINNLTPGSTGEAARVWLLRAHHGVDSSTGTAIVAIERLVAIAYLTASAAVIWLGHLAGWPSVAVLCLLAAVVVAPGLVYRLGLRPSALVAAFPAGRLLGAARWARVTAWLARVDATMASLLVQPVRLAVFATLTALVFGSYAAQLALVAAALGVPLDPVLAWGALGIAITAGVVSMLPFGLGSADLVLVALLSSLGIPAAEATGIALGYRLVSTLPLGIAGVAAYAWLSARLPAGEAAMALHAGAGDHPRDSGASGTPR
jgi:uncharacterized protein (TIRG00374 family)